MLKKDVSKIKAKKNPLNIEWVKRNKFQGT